MLYRNEGREFFFNVQLGWVTMTEDMLDEDRNFLFEMTIEELIEGTPEGWSEWYYRQVIQEVI